MSAAAPLGDLLLEHAGRAERRAVLCAPFVKLAVVERVLSALDPAVEVELFTRWRPEEVSAGVSDTGVLDLVEEADGAVFLHDPLHAKLFLFDDLGLIGSANLTARALGWTAAPNLELLVQAPADLAAVGELEAKLRAAAIRATAEIAAEVEAAAALLPRPMQRAPADPPPALPGSPEGELWRPRLREPRGLFVAYAKGAERLSAASAAAAALDLAALEIPPGLERDPFEKLVRTRLLQAQLIQRLDELLSRSRRFGEMRDALAEMLDLDREEAGGAWQTAMRWMLYFLPHRYGRSVPSHSEIMIRKE